MALIRDELVTYQTHAITPNPATLRGHSSPLRDSEAMSGCRDFAALLAHVGYPAASHMATDVSPKHRPFIMSACSVARWLTPCTK